MRSHQLHSILAVAALLVLNSAMAQVINLGTADKFSVLAGSGITNTGPTTISGNVGTFPTTSQTGFGSVTINGVNQGGNAITQLAKNDLITAYNAAASRPTSTIFAPAFDLGGLTLLAGVYNDPSSFIITGMLTLDGAGDPNSVWIFQAGSSLTTASNSSIILINGADGCRVFWQVGSSATLGTNTVFVGTILANTSINANTGTTVAGRLLAANGEVTLDTNTIVTEICAALITEPGGTDDKPTIEALKNALIVAAKLVDVNSLPGLTSIYTQGFAQFDTQVFTMQQRFADLRASSGLSGKPPEGMQRAGDRSSWSAKNPFGGKNPWAAKNVRGGSGIQPNEVQQAEDDRWGFFITATGDSTTAGDANNFDGTTIGTTLGMDLRFSDHFVGGVSLGYTHSRGDLMDGGKVEADGGKAALYGLYQHGGFYVEGLIGGGYNSYDIKRSAFLGLARGHTDGGQLDGYVGLGYDITRGGWTVTPMVSLLYTMIGINGYDEVGSLLPLKIESQDASSLRLRVGPRVSYTTQWGIARVTPSLSVQWQHEFLDDRLPFDARFASDPGSLFRVYGPKIGRDSVLITAALNIAWKRYAAYIAYQADLGRENYQSQSALVGFRVSW